LTGPPALIPPMLATLGALPAGPGWAYEFKWDGVRAVVYAGSGRSWLFTRNGRDVTSVYPELAQIGRRRVILDGEIVATEAPGGRPSFARLQRRMHVVDPPDSLLNAVPVIYYAFDVLQLDGEPTLQLSYERRRELLAGLPLNGTAVQIPDNQVGIDPAEMSAAAGRRGLEGVIAKRLASPYQPGRRSPDWIKAPFNRTQEVVIIGYKPSESGAVRSLAFAVHQPDGTLTFAGSVGTGFTSSARAQLLRQLKPWQRQTPPVPGIPRDQTRGVQWIEPLFVGEVTYRNWTPDGRLRHPSWRGLRPDLEPATVAVRGGMMTPDGEWHIDVLRRDGAVSYRIRHGDRTLDGLTITDVETILTEAGVDMGGLVEEPPAVTA
jgi:bifunctional non-homologous end joining protein LigD